MSYCRFSKDCNIYMYCCSDEGEPVLIECASCCLVHSGFPILLHSYEEAIEHLKKHREHGDKVPDIAFRELEMDLKEMKEAKEHHATGKHITK